MSAKAVRIPPGRIAEQPRLGNVLSSIAAGLVVSLVAVSLPISYAALIFTGALAGYVSSGVGLALFGGLVGGLVVAFTSSYPGSVFMPKSGPTAILVMSLISLLLNCSALELKVRHEVDLDRELRSAGLANLLAGSGGGLPGFQALILSMLGCRMNARSRLVALVPAVLNGAMLFIGAPVLSCFPKPALDGTLLLVGLTFLAEWTVDAWFKLSRADYAMVLLILVVIANAGVVEGVGVGVVLTIIHFVTSYGRVPVLRNTLSGRNFHSNVDRPWAERRIQHTRGHRLHVLELQGFIFKVGLTHPSNHTMRAVWLGRRRSAWT